MRFMTLMIPKDRCPARDSDIIRIRQMFKMPDFPRAVRKAAGVIP